MEKCIQNGGGSVPAAHACPSALPKTLTPYSDRKKPTEPATATSKTLSTNS